MKTSIPAALAAVLFAVPAMAQDPAPATKAETPTTSSPMTATSPAPGNAGDMGGGMTMGTTSTVALKFVTLADADIMASRLEDADVYNNENEDIGEIEDLVIKDGKTISGVVVSVGGFLGLGDRYVLLDPASIVLAERDGELRAMVNTSKDELSKAPEFTYEDRD